MSLALNSFFDCERKVSAWDAWSCGGTGIWLVAAKVFSSVSQGLPAPRAVGRW